MTEVWFYQLRFKPLEQVLPALLEKTRERGWRAVVQAASTERLEAIDQALWTYRDESFLAHGTDRDGHPELQPIWLTTGDDNPNSADIRLLVDGADAATADGYQRIIHIFDGDDEVATAAARETWKRMKAGGHVISFYQMTDTGHWQKKA